MIAISRQTIDSETSEWHAGFLTMFPKLERFARIAFRGLVGEAREDAVCEAIANCLCAYHRLYARNELHRVFASTLIRYAVAQYHAGRRVGTSQCSRDVYSTRAWQDAGVEIHSLGTPGEQHDKWRECLTDNGRTPVPDQVHFRIEFPRWLGTQTHRNRQIAERLMLGYSTRDVACEFKISTGRVSQLRMEFYDSWNQFTAERDVRQRQAGKRWFAECASEALAKRR